MLHDLALALGGMTVDELKEKMSYSELARWKVYQDVNGPLNPILRNDAAAARLARAMAGGEMSNFMPWPKLEKEDSMQSFEKVLKTLKFAASANKVK